MPAARIHDPLSALHPCMPACPDPLNKQTPPVTRSPEGSGQFTCLLPVSGLLTAPLPRFRAIPDPSHLPPCPLASCWRLINRLPPCHCSPLSLITPSCTFHCPVPTEPLLCPSLCPSLPFPSSHTGGILLELISRAVPPITFPTPMSTALSLNRRHPAGAHQ